MKNNDSVAPFLAGLGMGIAATILLAPKVRRNIRDRIADLADHAVDALKTGAGDLHHAAGDLLQEGKSTWNDAKNKSSEAASELGITAKEEIDHVGDAAKNCAAGVADKAREVAHRAGTKLEEGGKQLQEA